MSVTSEPAQSATSRLRRRRGIAAICVLAFGWALVMQSLGWAQTSYFAFVKALDDGTAQIDKYHWETRDKSWINGNFFSVKAPGMPLVLVPIYKLLKAAGAEDISRSAASHARQGGAKLWTYKAINISAYGYNMARAREVPYRLEIQAPLVWALGLFGSVLPSLGLLLLIRSISERIRPGYGTAAALTLGMSTMVMVFAGQLFGHMMAAFLVFGAFALIWRERRGPPKMWPVLLAGLAAGFAVTVEYPMALAGGVIGLYAVFRGDLLAAEHRVWPLLKRAIVYAVGVLVGIIPVLAYNQWAFGSPTTMSYSNAVANQGFSGHATLGLNSGGFFGIGVPDPLASLELLLAPRGILTITPVVLVGLYGVWLLRNRGYRAEARTIAAIVALFFIYDSGYWLPFGGGSPGPRFLIATLPFLALGFVEAWKRIPATTLVLAACGFTLMTIASLTYPLIGAGNLFEWRERPLANIFQHTVFTAFGLGNGWLTLIPVLAVYAAAIWLGARATGTLKFRADAKLALIALTLWVLLAGVLSRLLGERHSYAGLPDVANHNGLPKSSVIAAAGVALGGLLLALWAERRSSKRPQLEDQQRPTPLAAES